MGAGAGDLVKDHQPGRMAHRRKDRETIVSLHRQRLDQLRSRPCVRRLRCVCIAPFGWPVVPEVKKIQARSVSVIFDIGNRIGVRASNCFVVDHVRQCPRNRSDQVLDIRATPHAPTTSRQDARCCTAGLRAALAKHERVLVLACRRGFIGTSTKPARSGASRHSMRAARSRRRCRHDPPPQPEVEQRARQPPDALIEPAVVFAYPRHG